MKRLIILALSAAACCSVQAQLNHTGASSYIARSEAMLADDNLTGCLDQLSHVDLGELSPEERMRAAWLRAEATYLLCAADALPLYLQFLEAYPGSLNRMAALKRIADCRYARAEYALALAGYSKVDDDCLTREQQQEMAYRKAYCYLRIGEFDAADALFARLTQTDAYANDARFFRGYICYVKGRYDEAERAFRSVNTSTMPGAMADYYLAQIYYGRGEYAKALTAASDALRRGLDRGQIGAEANRIAGESLWQLNDRERAIPYLEAYLRSAETPALTALYIVGVNEYGKGNYARAIELLQPVTEAEPAMAQSAYLYIGQALMKQADTDAALLAFDAAVRLDADDEVSASAFYNYAVAKTHGGRIPFGSSVATFEEFLSRYPDSPYVPAVQEYIITGYITDNNYDKALGAIGSMAHPTEATIRAKQQILYTLGTRQLAAGDYAKAYEMLNEAAKIKPGDERVGLYTALSLGEAAYRLGKLDEAAANVGSFIKRAAPTDANYPVALYDMGYILMAQKRGDEAAGYFHRVLDTRPAADVRADVYNRLGDIAYYAGNFSDAATLYDSAYEANPSAGDYALFQKAMMRGYRRDYKGKIEGMDAMRRDFAKSALVPDAMLETTEAFLQLGRRDEAIALYRSLIEDYPSTPQARQAYLQMAQTLLNAGRRNEAIEAYRRVIVLYPTGDEALLASENLKRLYGESGQLDEYLAFMTSVENAPKVDVEELDDLSADAAQRRYDEQGSTDLAAEYLKKHLGGRNAARMLAIMMDDAHRRGDEQNAAHYAEQIVENFPHSNVAEEALILLAERDYDLGRAGSALTRWQIVERGASTPLVANTARMGIMRAARDTGDYEMVISTADAVLSSSTAGSENKNEAIFSRGLALANMGRNAEACDTWAKIADATDELYGVKSAFYRAENLFENGQQAAARSAAEAITDSGTPHIYWLARAFILLSDIYAAEGKAFEAREYLKSLRENYPGNESDIRLMIETRLNN